MLQMKKKKFKSPEFARWMLCDYWQFFKLEKYKPEMCEK